MKKIMVVAGGDWQIELIKKAKKMGHYVICSNLYENSPAFPYADACEVADVLDKEANLKIAQKYKPDAVISDQSDIAVPTVAYVNEKMGLRGIGVDKAKIFTNKYTLREFCRTSQIVIPEYRLCTTIDDAAEFLNQYEKIIIKPVDSQSSRGVFTIHSKEELQKHCKETLAFSNTMQAFLAEEFIGGDEFTIDGIVVNGRHYPLCISIKEMYEQNPNVSKMQIYTYEHPVYDYSSLRQINRELITKIGLPFGLTHTEYKFHNGKFYLIETAARGGGSNLSAKIVPYMSGVDNYEYLINSALGKRIDNKLEHLVLPKENCVIMRFFDFGEGKVKKVNGLEYLKSLNNVLDYQIDVSVGEYLHDPAYGRMRPGHFIIGGSNMELLREEMADILKNVTVEFE